MSWTWRLVSIMSSTGVLCMVSQLAHAQDMVNPGTSLVAGPGAAGPVVAAGEPGAAAAMLMFLAVTTAVLVAIVKVNELRSKREDEAIALQARIDDALLEIPGLLNSSVTPTVHLPTWKGSPARIVLSGHAPSPYLEQVALRATAQAASRVRSDVSIENQMIAVPRTGTRTAEMPERVAVAGTKGERTWLAAASHLRS
jgi:hypothetical protein